LRKPADGSAGLVVAPAYGGAAAAGEWAFGDGPRHPGGASREPDKSAAGAKTASAPEQAGAAANWRGVLKHTGCRISRSPSRSFAVNRRLRPRPSSARNAAGLIIFPQCG
jgi:hypothetical protein